MEKIWQFSDQLYKNYTDCFELEVLTVDTVSRFQNRICIIESQEKENKILYMAYEKMGAATVDSWWLKIWRRGSEDEAIIRVAHKFVHNNESLSFQMWLIIGFAQKGQSETILFLKYLQQGFVWSSIF